MACLAAPGQGFAAADPAEIGAEPAAAGVRIGAYGGVVVWNRVDSSTGRQDLVRFKDGVARPLRLRGRGPIGFDVGPGADGKPVVVYQRCARYVDGLGQGCVFRRRSVDSGRDVRVGGVVERGAEVSKPAIWRGRLAYVKTRDVKGYDRPRDELMVKDAGHHARRIAGGTPGVSDFGPDGTVTSLDVRGRRVLFSWNFTPTTRLCKSVGKFEPDSRELWVREDGRRASLLARTCQGTSPVLYDNVFLYGASAFSRVLRLSPDSQQATYRLSKFSLTGSATREFDLGGSQPPETRAGSLTDEQMAQEVQLTQAVADQGRLYFVRFNPITGYRIYSQAGVPG